VLGECPLCRDACRVDVAVSGEQHVPAPRPDGQLPWAVEPAALTFEHVDEWLGFLQPSQLDHGLDGVRDA
jgi:hypothetical protein